MSNIFSKLCCWFSGHEWETLQNYTVDISPLGRGVILHRKCSRCGEEQNLFECVAAFGTLKDEFVQPLKPSNMRVLSAYEESKQSNEEDNKAQCSSKKARKAKCEPCPVSEEVPDTSECNKG